MRRLLLPLVAAAALIAPSPASAIVNGSPAEQGEFPAQGVLYVDNNENPGPDRRCGGSLVGSRQFLTAADCVTDGSDALPEDKLVVRLGNVNRNAPDQDDYGVTTVDLALAFTDVPQPTNDAAVLTLDRVANYDPVRVVDSTETDLSHPGNMATVLGWGRIATGDNFAVNLQKVDVPVADDARCSTAYGGAFKPALMLCAADPLGTPPAAARDFCEGDEGGPLLVPDGSSTGALGGIASWHGTTACADPTHPGVYTQLTDGALNRWIHSKTPEADFDLSHQPRAGEPVTLTSTSRHPQGADYFTTFRWDLDNDGSFDDANGRSISRAFPTAGQAVAGLEASKPGGDKASIYYAFDVEPAPGAGTTTPTTPVVPTAKPPAKTAPFATILAAKRPKVKRGHFPIRIRFAKTAPKGTAVVEVYRGGRRIGIARTKVERGATKRVRVKLMRSGRRALRRSSDHRLKIRVRVRVGRTILRTKRLTIR
jgi:secreted trypsin-like serine protease